MGTRQIVRTPSKVASCPHAGLFMIPTSLRLYDLYEAYDASNFPHFEDMWCLEMT